MGGTIIYSVGYQSSSLNMKMVYIDGVSRIEKSLHSVSSNATDNSISSRIGLQSAVNHANVDRKCV